MYDLSIIFLSQNNEVLVEKFQKHVFLHMKAGLQPFNFACFHSQTTQTFRKHKYVLSILSLSQNDKVLAKEFQKYSVYT